MLSEEVFKFSAQIFISSEAVSNIFIEVERILVTNIFKCNYLTLNHITNITVF